MAYETNRFCWHGLLSTDVEKAAAFYQEVLGWKLISMPMGDTTATLFTAGEVPLAHYMTPPVAGTPSHWNSFLRVDDVDASSTAAAKNGGTVLAEPSDIPPGRFSVVQSPSGATMSLFHEADPAASHHPGGVGGVHWTELNSQDISKDIEWLKATFGYEPSEMPMPGGGTYYLLNHNGQLRCGAMAAFTDTAPSMWLSWFQVDDADAALKRVTNNGGRAFGEIMDMQGTGRMVMVADNTGAMFGIIKPDES